MRIEAGLHDVADFTPIKPGVYDFVLKEPMEIVPEVEQLTDIRTKQYTFIVRPEIASGEEAGKKVRRQFTNKSKGTRYFLKRFLVGVGVTVGSDGSFSSESVLGKRFRAAVFERTYKDQQGNERKASDVDVESIVAA